MQQLTVYRFKSFRMKPLLNVKRLYTIQKIENFLPFWSLNVPVALIIGMYEKNSLLECTGGATYYGNTIHGSHFPKF